MVRQGAGELNWLEAVAAREMGPTHEAVEGNLGDKVRMLVFFLLYRHTADVTAMATGEVTAPR